MSIGQSFPELSYGLTDITRITWNLSKTYFTPYICNIHRHAFQGLGRTTRHMVLILLEFLNVRTYFMRGIVNTWINVV